MGTMEARTSMAWANKVSPANQTSPLMSAMYRLLQRDRKRTGNRPCRYVREPRDHLSPPALHKKGRTLRDLRRLEETALLYFIVLNQENATIRRPPLMRPGNGGNSNGVARC